MPVDITKVHPTLLAKLRPVLDAMAAFEHPMRICQGARTAEYQHELWRQGRELPGAIVTNCDGYLKKSPHQIREDGYGHAVDCCFIDNPATVVIELPFDEKAPWAVYGALAQYNGLKWGGAFPPSSKLLDRPHVELPS